MKKTLKIATIGILGLLSLTQEVQAQIKAPSEVSQIQKTVPQIHVGNINILRGTASINSGYVRVQPGEKLHLTTSFNYYGGTLQHYDQVALTLFNTKDQLSLSPHHFTKLTETQAITETTLTIDPKAAVGSTIGANFTITGPEIASVSSQRITFEIMPETESTTEPSTPGDSSTNTSVIPTTDTSSQNSSETSQTTSEKKPNTEEPSESNTNESETETPTTDTSSQDSSETSQTTSDETKPTKPSESEGMGEATTDTTTSGTSETSSSTETIPTESSTNTSDSVAETATTETNSQDSGEPSQTTTSETKSSESQTTATNNTSPKNTSNAQNLTKTSGSTVVAPVKTTAETDSISQSSEINPSAKTSQKSQAPGTSSTLLPKTGETHRSLLLAGLSLIIGSLGMYLIKNYR